MKKENKIEIYLEIELKLKTFYNQRGFSSTKSPFGFNKNGCSVLLGSSSEFDDSITITPSFGVKNDLIQKVLTLIDFPNRVLHFTSTRTQGPSFAHEFGINDFDATPYVFIGKYGIKNSIYNYSISADTDLTPIIEDHINFMEKVGFKYFEALISVKGINEYFNSRLLNLKEEDFSSEEVRRSFQKEEILSAIVAAHLEKDQRYNEILDRYKKLYSEVELYLQDIEKLREHLAKATN